MIACWEGTDLSTQIDSAGLTGTFQPVEQLADASRGQCHTGIGGAVIQVHRVAVGRDGVTAGKDDVADVAFALVRFLGTEYPVLAALEAFLRRLQIE